MLIHLPRINRKAALLAGFEFGSDPTIEVDLATFGDNRALVVSALHIANDGSAALHLDIDLPTPDGILEAIQRAEVREQERRKRFEEDLRAGLENWIAGAKEAIARVNAAGFVEKKRKVDIDGFTATYSGFASLDEYSLNPRGWSAGVGYSHSTDETKRLSQDYADCVRAYRDRAKKADAEALEAAMPALREAVEKRKAALAEKRAERLRTGVYQIDTGEYNADREGRPWIARVVGLSGRTLQYAFGEWFGEKGCCGLLRVACRPGDFLARGQKDLRNPKDSWRCLYKMREDGGVVEVDYDEVVRAFLERASA